MEEQKDQFTVFVICGEELRMRKSASYRQVKEASKLLSSIGISENDSISDLIGKIGEKINDFMCIIFSADADKAAKIDFEDANFDDIYEAAASFLSSSRLLKKSLLIIQTIFQRLQGMILMPENNGQNITNGNASSTEPPEESGASVKNY